MANRIPGPSPGRLLVSLDVEGKPIWLRHHLVHRRYHRLLRRHRAFSGIRSEGQVVGEDFSECTDYNYSVLVSRLILL